MDRILAKLDQRADNVFTRFANLKFNLPFSFYKLHCQALENQLKSCYSGNSGLDILNVLDHCEHVLDHFEKIYVDSNNEN